MKRYISLSALVILTALTITACGHACRRVEEKFDHVRMRRHEYAMESRQMWNMGMRRGMGMDMRTGRRMGRGPASMYPAFNNDGFMRIERIPGLTDNQRKELADLRLKHMQEMDKFREEAFAKLQDLRESNRKAMMNILTPEQQKFLESGRSHQASVSPSTEK